MKADVEFLDIWEGVGSNDSDWGGHHYSFPVGYASTESGALLLARGKGGWGSNGSAKKVEAVRINNDVYVIGSPVDLNGEVAKKREEIKQEALAKLSALEREALGIKV